MAINSSIKLYQLNIPELSGYISEFIPQNTSNDSFSGLLNLVGDNGITVSGNGPFITIGQTGGFVSALVLNSGLSQLALQDSLTYYPLSNPSGYISTGSFLSIGELGISGLQWIDPLYSSVILDVATDYFYLGGPNSQIQFYDSGPDGFTHPFISGFDIYAYNLNVNTINGDLAITSAYLENNYVGYGQFDPSLSTGFSYLYLNDTFKILSSKFNQGQDFYLVGQNSNDISSPYLIDLYGSQAVNYSLPSGNPFILGFDVYGGYISSSGSKVLTLNDSGYYISPSQLLSTSGSLINTILRYRNGPNAVVISGGASGLQYISGESGIYIKTLGQSIIIGQSNGNTNNIFGNFNISGASGIGIFSSGQNIIIYNTNDTYANGNFSIIGQDNLNISGIGQDIYIGENINTRSTGLSISLPSGISNYSISFPLVLSNQPIVSCALENNINNSMYQHTINSVSTSGFNIYFSDNLSVSGYTLHTTIIW